jgi:dihydrofolate reductase
MVDQTGLPEEMVMTGRIHIDLFTALDGVAQAPGGPEEDTEGAFAFGGWQAPLIDETVGAQVSAGIRTMDALLLGRRTYDIFAGYWPHQLDSGAAEIARTFDAIPKYVASRGNPELGWRDSHLLGGDLDAEVSVLRERHREVHVIGSIDFARTLVARNLFDQLNLWVYPIVLGAGKRLFTPDGPPTSLRLLSAEPASEKGAVLLRYAPTGSVPETGVMT